MYHYGNEDSWPIPYISDNMIVVGPKLNQKKYEYVKAKIPLGYDTTDLKPVLEKASTTLANLLNPTTLSLGM